MAVTQIDELFDDHGGGADHTKSDLTKQFRVLTDDPSDRINDVLLGVGIRIYQPHPDNPAARAVHVRWKMDGEPTAWLLTYEYTTDLKRILNGQVERGQPPPQGGQGNPLLYIPVISIDSVEVTKAVLQDLDESPLLTGGQELMAPYMQTRYLTMINVDYFVPELSVRNNIVPFQGKTNDAPFTLLGETYDQYTLLIKRNAAVTEFKEDVWYWKRMVQIIIDEEQPWYPTKILHAGLHEFRDPAGGTNRKLIRIMDPTTGAFVTEPLPLKTVGDDVIIKGKDDPPEYLNFKFIKPVSFSGLV